MDEALRRKLAFWLLCCCLMVFATLVVGGVTRLTHSGLSIVEWQPLVGSLPPLSDAAWQELFAKYQQTPEYLKVNRGMSLAVFQRIFWWEYAHRLLGRAIGLVFVAPFAWFWLRHRLPAGLKLRLCGMFVLGGLQGAMGWYMVKSGLVDDPRVSHYRLTAHLALAFLVLGWMLWTALDLLQARADGPSTAERAGLGKLAYLVVGVVFVMAMSGGLVAGLHAGLMYATFPLMDGNWVPPTLLMGRPLWRNFFENPATVQFDHRLLGLVLTLMIAALWVRARRLEPPAVAGRAIHALAGLLVLQIGLGIATLLLVVPIPLAAAHQAGAMLLLGAAIWAAHELAR